MTVSVIVGDARAELCKLPADSVHCCVTSPPYYGLRDYGCEGQIGLEPTPDEYVAALVGVFREVRRVLRRDGTLWLNIGDSYSSHDPGGHRDGHFLNPGGRQSEAAMGVRNRAGTYVIGMKRKDLIGIPWMLAFALRADGWWLRQDIIWAKPNPMPESVTDRCTKAHEYLFLLSKSERYYYDAKAIAEPALRAGEIPYGSVKVGLTPYLTPGKQNLDRAAVIPVAENRNKRSVWTVPTQPYAEAHFATFPPALIEPCIKAGSPIGGTVLDPFSGAGTTGLVADRLGRNAIGVELNPEYAEMARRRITEDAGLFASVA